MNVSAYYVDEAKRQKNSVSTKLMLLKKKKKKKKKTTSDDGDASPEANAFTTLPRSSTAAAREL